jgi:hypothetical protein
MKKVMEHEGQCYVVTFCTFLIYFACPFLPCALPKFSKVLWYVFCGGSRPIRELCGKKTAAYGSRWTTLCALHRIGPMGIGYMTKENR